MLPVVLVLLAHGEARCLDEDDMCAGWASAGECHKNPDFMLERCQKSCLLECGAADTLLPRHRRAAVAAHRQRQALQPEPEAWESEDLEAPYGGSAIIEAAGEGSA